MKKAQTGEFIGIAILVIVLSLIVMFNKLGTTRDKLSLAENSVKKQGNIWISTSVTKFPFITEKGIPLNELFGDYVCYEDDIDNNNFKVDYGPTIGTIKIDYAVRRVLDNLYGEGRWKLQIKDIACFTSGDFAKEECTAFTGKYISYGFMFPLPCSNGMEAGKIYIDTR